MAGPSVMPSFVLPQPRMPGILKAASCHVIGVGGSKASTEMSPLQDTDGRASSLGFSLVAHSPRLTGGGVAGVDAHRATGVGRSQLISWTAFGPHGSGIQDQPHAVQPMRSTSWAAVSGAVRRLSWLGSSDADRGMLPRCQPLAQGFEHLVGVAECLQRVAPSSGQRPCSPAQHRGLAARQGALLPQRPGVMQPGVPDLRAWTHEVKLPGPRLQPLEVSHGNADVCPRRGGLLQVELHRTPDVQIVPTTAAVSHHMASFEWGLIAVRCSELNAHQPVSPSMGTGLGPLSSPSQPARL